MELFRILLARGLLWLARLHVALHNRLNGRSRDEGAQND